jgi:hypothetical protein
MVGYSALFTMENRSTFFIFEKKLKRRTSFSFKSIQEYKIDRNTDERFQKVGESQFRGVRGVDYTKWVPSY